MAAYYTLHIAGLTRELKICPISEKLDIAAFVLFSDVELTEACVSELIKRVPACDYILTADSGLLILRRIAEGSAYYSGHA